MNPIRWSDRPEDFTHVNPRNGRSYRVIGNYSQVWMNNQWNPSNVPVKALVAKPSDNMAHSEPTVEATPQLNNTEETPMKVQTLSISSKEDLNKFLNDTTIPAEVREELAKAVDGLFDDEDESCDCLECTRDALMAEMAELHKEAESIKEAVSAGSMSHLEAMKAMADIAIKVAEVATKVEVVTAHIAEENEEDTDASYLANVVQEVVAFLEEKGIDVDSEVRAGFITSQAMTIAALDDLGYIVKK